MCVCLCVGGGGGEKGLENFYMQTFVYMRLLLQALFFCFSVLLQTLFYFHTNYFRVSASANNLFQNFPTPSPNPRRKKKIGLSPRRSEIMLKLKPGRRHLSMNTSQSGSSMKD